MDNDGRYEVKRGELSLFSQRLPTDEGQLHFLTGAGIGDNLWVVSKLWSVCIERDVTFWLPGNEQHRSGDLFRMMGLRYGYMPDLSTKFVWDRPGEPAIPDTGAVLTVQPNKHLEQGHRIEKWYAEYPFRNPVEFLDVNTTLFKQEAGGTKYVVGFMSQQGYMDYGGNLKPAQWARIWKQVEKDIGPVCLIGAGDDVKFLEEVMKYFEPTLPPVLNHSLDQVTHLLSGAEMAIGAASGPMILSTYMGIPTLHAYPRWLAPMPGTWEQERAVWGACFLDELENVVREGITFNGIGNMLEMRQKALPRITVNYQFGQKPAKWTIPAETKKNGHRKAATNGVGKQVKETEEVHA